MPQAVRSVLAIIAAFLVMMLVVILLTLICMKAFHLQSGHPTPLYLALNIIYTLLAAVLGGFVAGKIGRSSPLAHGVALAVLMLVFSLVTFSTSAGGQPFGYRIFLLLGPPVAAIGGAALVKRPS